MFDSFVFLPLSTRAYFKGRAYIKIILKNHARSYFAGRSYYRGNTVCTVVSQYINIVLQHVLPFVTHTPVSVTALMFIGFTDTVC